MIRVIPFAPYTEDTELSKRFFDIIWGAIILQGNPRDPNGGSKGRPARKQAKRIMAEFRTISEPMPKAPEGHDGRNLITLSKAGGKIALADDDFKKVVEWIDDVPWKGDGVEDADDCVTWLETHEAIKAKEVKAAVAAAIPEKTGDSSAASEPETTVPG